jgi:3-hydroxy-9,10-secoandrosta-1,3,5(10)-triene-9,17-dione monooxygenase reductase component
MSIPTPPIAAEDYRKVLGHFPTGVAVVTGCCADGPIGLTIQSVMALSLDPALVLVSIDRKSTSWPVIAEGSRFVVNVLAEGQHELALAFAKSGGAKFTAVPWTPGPRTAAPILGGVLAWVECVIRDTFDGGDHDIVTAHVVGLGVDTTPPAAPLVFLRSRFTRVDATPSA